MCYTSAVPATTPCLFDSSDEPRWPGVERRRITIGGVTVTCEQAIEACKILASNGACAIKAILAAAGNPLSECDYHAVYKPHLDLARQRLNPTGKPGGAGRHAAKLAFRVAVYREVAVAAHDAMEDALAAFTRDERYASAIAQDAHALAARRKAPVSA